MAESNLDTLFRQRIGFPPKLRYLDDKWGPALKRI